MSKSIKLRLGFLLTLATFAPAPSYADGFVVGKVEYIRVHDPAIAGTAWTPPTFWFSLAGVTIPSCPGWTGRTIMVSQSKESLALIISAQLTGRQVAVYYTDSSILNGYCRAGYITTGDPPPAF